MIDEELKELEEEQARIDDFAEVPPNDIVAYNELRSCADLKRMKDSNQLVIKPDFQRDVVWLNPAKTRFIDSLIKQLPIPSMCISLDYKTNSRLVIDGLQRINSIITFLSDDEWKLSQLDDIDPKISGKSVEYIKTKLPEYYDRVENLTIPVTVLRCDYSKKAHMHYLFTIFHRLNTGGNKLNNQEIRNCIYNGAFNDFLKREASYENYVNLFGIEGDRTYRFAHEEMILRFFAFNERLENYNGKLAKFLNDYMDDNKNLSLAELANKKHIIERTVDLLFLKMFNSNPISGYSKTFIESLMIGISKNINILENENAVSLQSRLTNLQGDENFNVDNLKEGLSQKEKVIKRIRKAIEIFS